MLSATSPSTPGTLVTFVKRALPAFLGMCGFRRKGREKRARQGWKQWGGLETKSYVYAMVSTDLSEKITIRYGILSRSESGYDLLLPHSTHNTDAMNYGLGVQFLFLCNLRHLIDFFLHKFQEAPRFLSCGQASRFGQRGKRM